MNKDKFFSSKQINKDSILLTRFLTFYKKGGKHVFGFCEGQDDFAFYRSKIKTIYNDYKIKLFNCDSKENVYQTYSDIKLKGYEKNRILFFVDKDYDDFLKRPPLFKDENIFESKYYAIENHVATPEVLEIVLQDFHGINDDQVLDDLVMKFTKLQVQFYHILTSVTCFILAIQLNKQKLKQHYKEDIPTDKRNLFNLKLTQKANDRERALDLGWFYKLDFQYNKVYEKSYISPDLIGSHYLEQKKLSEQDRYDVISYTFLEKCLKETKLELPENFSLNEDISHFQEILQTITEPKFYIRGKYDQWFFVKFIAYINGNGFPAQQQVTKINFMSILGAITPMPQDLHDFLTHNYNQLQKSKNV